MMSLESILKTLTNHLIATDRLTCARLAAMTRLQLSFLLMQSYISYPLPLFAQAAVPYNYCALTKMFPWLTPALTLVC